MATWSFAQWETFKTAIATFATNHSVNINNMGCIVLNEGTFLMTVQFQSQK